MGKVQPRAVTPFLEAIRNFLLGRAHTSALRFEDYYAARTQPLPELPEGPAHKLSVNYYYSRDGRREVAIPTLLASPKVKLIQGKKSENEPIGIKNTPGTQWKWD